MIVASIAIQNVRQEIKNTDGKIGLFTQFILLLFLMTLSLSSASIQRYLNDNLNNLLGADLVISGYRPIPEEQQQTLNSLSKNIEHTQQIPLVITHKDAYQKAQVKLVSDSYPLQGSLKTSQSKGGIGQDSQRGPDVNEVWVGPRLAASLSIDVGDELLIASQRLTVSAILLHEPDRLLEGHSVDMRAMVHESSLPQSLFHSSRHQYRYLINADDDQRIQIKHWQENNLPDFSLVGKDEGKHPLSLFWQRTENFLGLASVIIFFMAAIAIDMTSQGYIERQKRRIALYLSFGESTNRCLSITAIQWLIGFVSISMAAIVFAYGAEYLIVTQLTAQFPEIEWGWHLNTLTKTWGLAGLLLIAFQFPAFWSLYHVSIVRLIRAPQDHRALTTRLFWNFASLSLLAAYYSDNPQLTALTLGSMLIALTAMVLMTWIILRVGEYWGQRNQGLLSVAFFLMRQRILNKATQIMGLGLCCLLLLFTLMLMKDIGTEIERSTRTHDGNLIISELSAKDLSLVQSWASKTNSNIRQLRPYTSAKLISVNKIPLNTYARVPSDALATLQNPIRLSWSDAIPPNNKLTAGKWWGPKTPQWQQVSVESEVISDMGLAFGDLLTFAIQGQHYEFELVASHAYKPGGGSVTFWFQAPESMRTNITTNTYYMGSMELPDPAWSLLKQLWEENPTLSLVPLHELTQRYDDTLAIVSKLTIGFASMILLMSALVIAASIKGHENNDKQKNGLLMSMGLSKSQCARLTLYDWLTVSGVASLGAVLGTWIAGHLIYQSQFSLNYTPDFTWLIGIVLGVMFLVCAIGGQLGRQSLDTSINDLIQYQ
jgi:predicted lysophospholipase L1 biosynthesis ABC-type transport system permease subunit